jgi:tRNA threonylcarbamoyladenosine biosynthesis protein TsaB
MIFLGMDTSTSCGTVALVSEKGLIAEYSLNLSRTHSQRLLPGIEKILKDTGMRLDQIDGIAVTVGPGSFTGLRIGLSTAKALALATRNPLVGIPSLDVLAENVPYCSLTLCPVLDARRGELFAAFYRWKQEGSLERFTDYLSIQPDMLLERIEEPVLFVGDGALHYEDKLRDKGPLVSIAPAELHYPRASVLCRLAMVQREKEGGVHPRDLKALYVRASDAELKHHP